MTRRRRTRFTARTLDDPTAAPLVVPSGAYPILHTHREDGTVLVEHIVRGAREPEGVIG